MQAPGDILFALQRRGIVLKAKESQIEFRAERGALSVAELGLLRDNKAEILGILSAADALARTPISPRSRSEPIALTATQRLPWFCTERGGARPRSEPFAFRISGPLIVENLERALEEIVRRHESLRTRILQRRGIALQAVNPPISPVLRFVDLSRESLAIAEKRMERDLREFIDHRIDYERDALFAARLLKLAEHDHVLMVSADHLVTDGASNRILKNEIWALYAQGRESYVGVLPELAVQFWDYASWLHETYAIWLRSNWRYLEWRLRTAPVVELPCISRSGYAGKPGVAGAVGNIDSALYAGIASFARSRRTFVPLVVLAAYVSALTSCLRQDDFVVTLVESGRHRAELVRMVGCLVAHIKLRVQVQGQALGDLVDIVTHEYHSASRYRDFDRLWHLMPAVKWELMFNWQTSADEDENGRNYETYAASAGLKMTTVPAHPVLVQEVADALPDRIYLAGIPSQGGASLHLRCRTARFQAPTMERLMQGILGSLQAECSK